MSLIAAVAEPTRMSTVLDTQTLARLAELDPGGAAGLVVRVLRTYAASLGRLREQLVRGRAAADHDTMRHVAHTLKSSSASVGALELSQCCAELEQRVRSGALDGVDDCAARLLAELDRVHAALRPDAPA